MIIFLIVRDEVEPHAGVTAPCDETQSLHLGKLDRKGFKLQTDLSVERHDCKLLFVVVLLQKNEMTTYFVAVSV